MTNTIDAENIWPYNKVVLHEAEKEFSVIIPSSNPQYLHVCLKNLCLHSDYLKEVIVVEDWTYYEEHAIENLCKKYGATYRRLDTPKRNRYDFRAPEARSLGQDMVTGDIVLFLDEDCLPCTSYFNRLHEIHTQHQDVVFSARRIFLIEDMVETQRDWHRIVLQWPLRQYEKTELCFYDGPFSCGPENTYIQCLESNNCSVRRSNLNRIGEWEHFFGYGEEDLYWAFKAMRSGLRGAYFPHDKDTFVFHMKHPPRNGELGLNAVNRLYLCEKDEEFGEAIRKQHLRYGSFARDWVQTPMQQILTNGLNSLEIFEYLPALPSELQKYVRGG